MLSNVFHLLVSFLWWGYSFVYIWIRDCANNENVWSSFDNIYHRSKSLTHLRSFCHHFEAQLFLVILLDQHIYPQPIYQMQLTRDEDTKHNHKSWQGLELLYVRHKTKSTLYRTERGREAKAPECCSQKAEPPFMYVCVCAWMKMLLHYNLLTTDSVAAQAAWGAAGAPPCAHACVCVV